MVPYNIGDCVRFINEKDSTITLTTTKETSSWHLFEDIFLFEERTIQLQSENSDYSLSLIFDNLRNALSSDRKLFISFCSSIDSCRGKFVLYDTEGNFTTNDYQHVYDSLQIDNHTYFDVVVNDGFYYNKTHGVLQIKDKENNILFKLIP